MKTDQFLKDFAQCVWPAAPYIHCTKADAKKKEKKDCTQQQDPYYRHNKTAQKKSLRKKKKNKSGISFKENATKESNKQTKILSKLDYLQTVQSFYFGHRNLYSRTEYFYQSEVKIHFKGINSNEKVMAPAQ